MDCLWCGRSLWCRGLFDATALLIKMFNLKLIYSYTSTWPVPSSTILSCAATSGWACINEASNFSCVTWAKENIMIKQYYKDTVIRSNLYLGWFSFKIWRLFCYVCVCVFLSPPLNSQLHVPILPFVFTFPRPWVWSFTVHLWNSCLKRADSAPSFTVSTFVVIG